MYLTQFEHTIRGTILFSPAGSIAGIKGCTILPSSGDGETVEQSITLDLEGTAAQIENAIYYLNLMLYQAKEEAAKANPNPVYLVCQVAAGDLQWRSPVWSGRLELLRSADQRGRGRQGIKITLTRANWWERKSELTLLPDMEVYNQKSGMYTNQLRVTAIQGDAATPARLSFNNTGSPMAGGAWSVFAGLRADQNLSVMQLYSEGENGTARAGVTQTNTSEANTSSGDSYAKLDWSGSGMTRLWHTDLTHTQEAGGGAYRVVARLAAGLADLASEKTRLKWELAYQDGGTPPLEYFLYESAPAYVAVNNQLVLGPVVHVPPYIPEGTTPNIRLVLAAQAAGSGAHTLKLDWVDLMGVDSWRQYLPTPGAIGINVNDHGQTGMAGAPDGSMTHTLDGPGLWLQPGKAQHISFAISEGAGGVVTAAANMHLLVNLYYRPRKRTL